MPRLIDLSELSVGTISGMALEACRVHLAMPNPNPFRYFRTGREIIRLAVMLYVRFPSSLRNVEDLLHERGIDVSHESVRFCVLNIVVDDHSRFNTQA